MSQDYFVNVVNTDPIPVTLGSSNITVTGSVNVGSTVEVISSPSAPIHDHITEVGTSGILDVPYLPIGGAVSITGTPTVNIAATAHQGKLWTQQVAEGLIPDHQNIQITGYNPSTSAGDAIWAVGTPFPWSSFNTTQTLYFKSSTNNATDRGMSIVLEGLDADFNPQSEVIILNASNSTTPVTTVKQYLRLEVVYVVGPNTNAGDITVTTVSGSGTVVKKLSAGRGSSRSGNYTVPAGYTAWLWKGDASSTGATVVNFMVRYYGQSFMVAHVAIVDNSTYIYDFPFARPLPEKTDLYCQVETGSGKTGVNFEILLVKNP